VACFYINRDLEKLSIIIPAYNEAATITLILQRIFDATLPNGIAKAVLFQFNLPQYGGADHFITRFHIRQV